MIKRPMDFKCFHDLVSYGVQFSGTWGSQWAHTFTLSGSGSSIPNPLAVMDASEFMPGVKYGTPSRHVPHLVAEGTGSREHSAAASPQHTPPGHGNPTGMQQIMRSDGVLGTCELSAMNLAPAVQPLEFVDNLDHVLWNELADQQTAKLYGILDDLLQYVAVRLNLFLHFMHGGRVKTRRSCLRGSYPRDQFRAFMCSQLCPSTARQALSVT
jgi:hypothetical protein